jgi:hypothetical protein
MSQHSTLILYKSSPNEEKKRIKIVFILDDRKGQQTFTYYENYAVMNLATLEKETGVLH